MKELFKKKLFLEIYIPMAIVVSPFLAMIMGFAGADMRLSLSFCICVIVAILVSFLVQRKRASTNRN
ncbi:MAG: hypothetical protein JWR50_3897 [Mucilaginibacter sp.]|nr:hypothetical protein [Mucilaginibacter sp.]